MASRRREAPLASPLHLYPLRDRSPPWRVEGSPWWNSLMLLLNRQADPAWPTEPGSGRGRSHGTSSREAFDRWFRYPAGFASDYVELLLDRLALTEGTVIDCFAGSGVTGTAAALVRGTGT